MKNFVLCLFIITSVSISAVAQANLENDFLANDPRFSFVSAETTFNQLPKPETNSLLGKWTVIGIAISPNIDDDANGGYWPEGKKPLAGYSGLFWETTEISTTTDSLGSQAFSLHLLTKGVETGKIYFDHTYSGSINENQLTYYVAADGMCRSTIDCRVTEAMQLLCRVTNRDTRCGRRGEINAYELSKKF